jgi:hypothetical protein
MRSTTGISPVSKKHIGVWCQISWPVDGKRGPFAGFAIEVGPPPGRRRSRSVDWPAATGRWGIPRREARRADFTGLKGGSTMVVNLIMRSCRLGSLANQIGPAGQRRQRGPTYLARDNRFLGGDHRMGLLGIAIGRQGERAHSHPSQLGIPVGRPGRSNQICARICAQDAACQRRHGLRRGRRSGPDTSVRRPSSEVSVATRDDARQQRQTSYGS